MAVGAGLVVCLAVIAVLAGDGQAQLEYELGHHDGESSLDYQSDGPSQHHHHKDHHWSKGGGESYKGDQHESHGEKGHKGHKSQHGYSPFLLVAVQ